MPLSDLENIAAFDFAYNVDCDPAQVLQALAGLSHPAIRKNRAIYAQSRIQSNGVQLTGNAFTFSAYVKSMKSNSKNCLPAEKLIRPTDNVLRIEVQAKTKSAVRTLAGVNKSTAVTDLSIEKLWTGYRQFLSRFPSTTSTDDECTLHSAIALLHQNAIPHPSRLEAIEWWKRGKSPETIRKDLKKILTMSFDQNPFHLLDLIPPEFPTTFHDVLADGTSRSVMMHSDLSLSTG